MKILEKLMNVMLTLLITVATLLLMSQVSSAGQLTLDQAIEWLQNESHRIIRASKRTMNDGIAAFPPRVGIGYEAFWLRDYAYTLEGSADAYSDRELTDACRVFIKNIGPDGAGVDCVKFDGSPIYKPGYGTMGDNPVADGSQFTVAVAWHTYHKTKDTAFLKEIIDPLIKTMKSVPRNAETRLVHIKTGEWDRCPYGFTDTVRMQGDVLFCSLLYVEACHRLVDMLNILGMTEESAEWSRESNIVTDNIRKVFWDSQVGLFRSATVQCRQHHIWGSAFAVYLSVATREQATEIAAYFKNHYNEIVYKGQIRHLPGGIYWEKCSTAKDTYQNGAYWATPTGWFVYTLDQVDSELADNTVIDLVTCFKEKGACEWSFGDTYRLPDYLASASLPLAGIRAMIKNRNK